MSRSARALIGLAIGLAAGLASAAYNGHIGASPAVTTAGDVAYYVGLLTPFALIGASIGWFAFRPRK